MQQKILDSCIAIIIFSFPGGCLKVNPEHRLTISQVLERVAAIAESNNYNLRAPLDIQQIPLDMEREHNTHVDTNHITKPPPPRPSQPSPAHNASVVSQPRREPPVVPPQRPVMPPPQQQQRGIDAKPASGLFSSIRGGAGSFLKNLKDTSSKVMHTMQQ